MTTPEEDRQRAQERISDPGAPVFVTSDADAARVRAEIEARLQAALRSQT